MSNTPKASASQYAYESIKEWILSGFLKPSEKIDQDGIAQRLSLSRMPVRVALDRLAADGLTIVTPHRGAVVAPLDANDLNNLYDTRAQLEASTVILATLHATPQSIQKLNNLLSYQRDKAETTQSSILENNRNFHRCVAQMAESDIILHLFDNLFEQCERYRRIYFRVPHSNDRIISEHQQLVNLMEAGDPQSAADFMITHLRTSQEALLGAMGQEISPLIIRPVYQRNAKSNNLQED